MDIQFGQKQRLKAVGYIGRAASAAFDNVQFQQKLASYLKEYAAEHAIELTEIILETENHEHILHRSGVHKALYALERGAQALIVLLDKPDARHSSILTRMLTAFEDKKLLDISKVFQDSYFYKKKSAALLLLQHGALEVSDHQDDQLQPFNALNDEVIEDDVIVGADDISRVQILSLARKMRITALYIRVMACEIRAIHRKDKRITAQESLVRWKQYIHH